MQFVSNDFVIDGWLEKKGHFRKNWKLRYVRVEGGTLSYYVDQTMATKKGEILLDKNTRILSRDGRSHCFKFGLTNSSSFLELCADSEDQRKSWIKALKVHLGQEELQIGEGSESGANKKEQVTKSSLNRLSGGGLREVLDQKAQESARPSDTSRPHVIAANDDSDNDSFSSSESGLNVVNFPSQVDSANVPSTSGPAVEALSSSGTVVEDDITHLLPDLDDLL